MNGDNVTGVTAPEAPAVETAPEPAAPPSPGAALELARCDVPPRLADQLALAESVCKTNLMPAACRTPAGALAAMYAARALQVPFWTVAQNMHQVDGKVGYDASFIRALVIRAGHKFRVTERTAERAVVRIIRHDDPEPFYSEFTAQDAVDAGLLTPTARTGEVKDNWRKYIKAMLVARATTIAVREACPEVMFGNGYTPEELGADTDEDGAPLMTVPAQQGPVVAAAEQVRPTPEQIEAHRAKWRDDIANAPDLEAVDALYQRARSMNPPLLDRPLYDDGKTVEAALAERANDLRAGAGDQDDVVDADVIDDTSVGASEPDSNETPDAVGGASEPDPAPPVPDPPLACRDSAKRRGVLKLLSDGGDVANLVDVEFGLPLAQVSTERLVKLHLRLQKEARS